MSMPAPTSATKRHIWQLGHVGTHPQYGLVTLFDKSGPDNPTNDEPCFLMFVNAQGQTHQHRDDGRDQLSTVFLYDSGYKLKLSDHLSVFMQAFAEGRFERPAPVHERFDSFVAALKQDNLAAACAIDALEIGWQITLVCSREINLDQVFAARSQFGLIRKSLRVKRSGPNAVVRLVVVPMS